MRRNRLTKNTMSKIMKQKIIKAKNKGRNNKEEVLVKNNKNQIKALQ